MKRTPLAALVSLLLAASAFAQTVGTPGTVVAPRLPGGAPALIIPGAPVLGGGFSATLLSPLALTPALAPAAIAPAPVAAIKARALVPAGAARFAERGYVSPASLVVAKTLSGALAAASAQGKDLAPTLAAAFDGLSAASAGDGVAAGVKSSYDILRKLGVRDRILAGGGIKTRADGTIEPVKTPIRFFAFDNDDNIAYYRTNLYVRHKTTHEERPISTPEFAEVRTSIGKSGKYKDYELFGFNQADGGSFRDFIDVKDPDVFSKDLTALLSIEAGAWRAPSWFSFATALNDPKTAPWVSIVTSRGHKPASFVKGFARLQELGYLKGTLREEMMFGVGLGGDIYKMFPTSVGTPEKKVEVLIELLDLIESVPLAESGASHSFGFSDDDVDMITRVKDRLVQEQTIGGRWPHIKISVFSTGVKHESIDVLVAPR